MKKLKKNHIPKSDIISITGHRNEAGLDAYDSGDENEQQAISFAIDNHKQNNEFKKYHVVSADDDRLKNPCFKFFPEQDSKGPISSKPYFTYNNCTVNFYDNGNPFSTLQQTTSINESCPPKKRRRVIYSSDSSQENDVV